MDHDELPHHPDHAPDQHGTAPHDAPLEVAAVDDHPALLSGLRVELADLDPGLRLVVTAPTVDDLLAEGRDVPDIVLLDLRLGDGSRPEENVAKLVDRGSRVLVYTEGRQHTEALAALQAGAQGVLLKDKPVATVAAALRAVAAGETLGSAETAAALQVDESLTSHLSPQERRVLELYAGGMPARSVALRLGVTLETAKSYLKRIRAKYAALDRPAYTRMELYRRAVEDGVLHPLESPLDGRTPLGAVPDPHPEPQQGPDPDGVRGIDDDR